MPCAACTFDAAAYNSAKRVDPHERPAVRSVSDDTQRTRRRLAHHHPDQSAAIAVDDRRADDDRADSARPRS